MREDSGVGFIDYKLGIWTVCPSLLFKSPWPPPGGLSECRSDKWKEVLHLSQCTFLNCKKIYLNGGSCIIPNSNDRMLQVTICISQSI